MVPERREIFNEMTVGENLEMGAFIQRRKPREVKEDLEWVRELFPVLKERARSTAGMLSGGQQQMLSIARALMARPRLLLLDEPSLGLAPVLAQEMFNVVARIAQEGVTILLVEQNAHQALKVSQYGYVLEAGHIVLAGPSAELLDRDMVRKSYLGELEERSS
jgi:branched-chain amino acid transport system ATP-binding protein